MPEPYVFRGDGAAPADPHPLAPKRPEPYVAGPDLRRAVNLAIYLGRPLLLEGEAGSGKSRLAYAVAHELGLPLYPWHVRSTSKALDGLYTYDALLRLHDVHLRAGQPPAEAPPPLPPDADDQGDGADDDAPVTRIRRERDPAEPSHYRRLGPLGHAFVHRDRPAVVLIDEVDKADVDFPNDLLTVLDAPWSFDIPETGERIRASSHAALRPIVLVTSNKEKGNLPLPFLRRCIYHYISFPAEPELRRIVEAHYAGATDAPGDALVSEAAARFMELRADDAGLFKKPGVSEFLDWLRALQHFGGAASAAGAPPHPGLLLKLRADWQRHVSGA